MKPKQQSRRILFESPVTQISPEFAQAESRLGTALDQLPHGHAPLPRHLLIVIPAHNEEVRVAQCLIHLATALSRPIVSTISHTVVVVADGCRDDTVPLVLQSGHTTNVDLAVLEIEAHNTGLARKLGFHYAFDLISGLSPTEIWCATTDADSKVPPNWIERQLLLRSTGAMAIAGGIRVADWNRSTPNLRHRYTSYMRTVHAKSNPTPIYGANMSFSACLYRRSGGFRPLETGEDRDLWERLSRLDPNVMHDEGLWVTTSARLDYRAPGGFGALLEKLSGKTKRHLDPNFSDTSRDNKELCSD